MPDTSLIANVDLDGTVADYAGAMQEALEAMRSPAEPPFSINDYDDLPPWIEARMDAVKKRPGFWLNLKPIPEGMALVRILHEEYGFSLNILTKGPATTHIAWTEKVQWAQRHVPDAQVTITQDKGLVYGRVLVDDWPPYIKQWLKWRPRGLVLMLDQPWNKEFKSTNVIRVARYTGLPENDEKVIESWERVHAALTRTALRKDNEMVNYAVL